MKLQRYKMPPKTNQLNCNLIVFRVAWWLGGLHGMITRAKMEMAIPEIDSDGKKKKEWRTNRLSSGKDN